MGKRCKGYLIVADYNGVEPTNIDVADLSVVQKDGRDKMINEFVNVHAANRQEKLEMLASTIQKVRAEEKNDTKRANVMALCGAAIQKISGHKNPMINVIGDQAMIVSATREILQSINAARDAMDAA